MEQNPNDLHLFLRDKERQREAEIETERGRERQRETLSPDLVSLMQQQHHTKDSQKKEKRNTHKSHFTKKQKTKKTHTKKSIKTDLLGVTHTISSIPTQAIIYTKTDTLVLICMKNTTFVCTRFTDTPPSFIAEKHKKRDPTVRYIPEASDRVRT